MPRRDIPFVDLAASHAEVADDIWAGWRTVLDRSAFVLGEEVDAFERAFAEFENVDHCIGVGNGTDALELALRAAGVGRGDEVIVPANSFVASALAVVRAGARPVFVDVDESTLLIDPGAVREAVCSRTKAIMPVHLYGQIAPVEHLDGLGPRIIEDAAQAHGALRNGAAPGSWGIATATSFYPSKNLGAYGDGGAVLTNDAEIARRVRVLRNCGTAEDGNHTEQGMNSRLDTLQATVLLAKLPLLSGWNAARARAAQRYDDLLCETPQVVRPEVREGNEHVWHLYVVRVPNRDDVRRHLSGAGIQTGIHYRTPIHLEDAFRDLGYRHGAFPVAERSAAQVLSLPMFPQITPEQQERVATALKDAIA